MQSFKIRFRIYDLLFYLLLVLSFYFTRNMLCRLMMVAFFGYTVVLQILQRRKATYSFFFFGFAVFVLYGFGNVLLNNVISTSVARTMVISLTLNLLMIYAISQYVVITDDVSRVLRITELGIFTTALVVMLLSLGTITQGRLGKGTEINSNMLSILCVYGLVLSLYLRKTDKLAKYAAWFRVCFYMLSILLTGSRKGLLMAVLAIAIIQFVLEKRKLARNTLVGIGIVVFVYVLIMNVEFLYNVIGVRVESMLGMLSGKQTEEASLNDRMRLVELGLRYIKEKPWTGYGYDCFKLISGMGPNGKVPVGSVGFYSHNNYIELLFGGGIIGLALYYIPILYLLKELLKGLRKNTCMPYFLAMVVSQLAVEYARVTYYARVDAYIMGIVLGCALVAHKEEMNGSPAS